MRVAILFFLAGSALLGNVLGLFPFYPWAYPLFALGAVLSYATLVLFRRGWWLDTVSRVMVTCDIGAITALVWVTGGVESPFLPLYPFQISATGTLGDERLSRDNAVLGTLLFAALAWGNRFGLLRVWGFQTGLPAHTHETGYVVLVTLIVGGSMILAHFASGYLARRLRLKEQDLESANRKLASLYDLSQRLSTSLRLDEVLSALLTGIVQGLEYERTAVFLLDRDQKVELDRRFSLRGGNLAPTPEDLSRIPSLVAPEVRGQTLWVPIRLKGETVGALAAEASGKGPPAGDALSVLATIVGQMAVAVENARLYETTERLARTDGLTGLYNRRYFQERLEEEFFRSRRYGDPLSLVLIDVDHFKTLNDTQGHAVGDQVLKQVSAAMIESSRRTDLPARFGGDEFALLLPVSSKAPAVRIADRIREKIRNVRLAVPRGPRKVTLSAGVAQLRPNMGTPQALLESADLCLYEAKRRGRDLTVAEPPRQGTARLMRA